MLKMIIDNGRQHRLAGTGLSSNGEHLLLAFQESGQVWLHPQAGSLFTFLG
jgi:uncharacterized protein (AIM24 family)